MRKLSMKEVDSLWSCLNFFLFTILNRACQVGKQHQHDWRLKPDTLHHTQQPWTISGCPRVRRELVVLLSAGQAGGKLDHLCSSDHHLEGSVHHALASHHKGLCVMFWLPGCVAKCQEMKAHGGRRRVSWLLWVPAAEKPVAGGLAWWPFMMS